MGLDAIELVMTVEDRFNIILPDAATERVRTVADLAAIVLARLPKTRRDCPTARAFFDFRRLVTTHAHVPRRHIRPATTLASLFPPASYRIWNRLRKLDRRLPALVGTRRAEGSLLACGVTLTVIYLAAAVSLFLRCDAIIAFAASVLAGSLALATFLAATRLVRRHFPHGIESVADIARLTAPIVASGDSPGERLVAQHRVVEEVRRLTALQLGLPIETVLPTSHFVKDLGID